MQKSVVFVYTHQKKFLKSLKGQETIPLALQFQKIKFLGINLTKHVKDLYNENYKALKKEIIEDIRRWKDLPCSWTSRINSVKMTIIKRNVQIQCNHHQNSINTETPYIALLNKNVKFFSSIKVGNSRTEQVLSGVLVPIGEGRMWGKGVGG
jgi:hypothetical protein